ncbi:hypothetical protein P8G24_004704 [Salmonella enterica]|nr:hypothetical protein [Salmonella enterica]
MEFVKEIDGKKVKAVQAENGKLYLIWDNSPFQDYPRFQDYPPLKKRGATYDSLPCIKCGDVRRYVSNGHCPACHNERNKITRVKNQ